MTECKQNHHMPQKCLEAENCLMNKVGLCYNKPSNYKKPSKYYKEKIKKEGWFKELKKQSIESMFEQSMYLKIQWLETYDKIDQLFKQHCSKKV